MTALPVVFPRVPLKSMDPAMLVFELDRETLRLMPWGSALITSAATVASFLHRKQTRAMRASMPRVPYIEHPLRVALRLIRWGVGDAQLIAAALLHDVVEDCSVELLLHFGRPHETALECIARLYGNGVAELVSDVTNPTDGTGYVQHIRALVAIASDSLLLKASDLKDNAGSIRHQLGHGMDQRMLRLLRKYAPVVDLVVEGLRSRLRLMGSDQILAYAEALVDMEQLQVDLEALAHEHSIEL